VQEVVVPLSQHAYTSTKVYEYQYQLILTCSKVDQCREKFQMRRILFKSGPNMTNSTEYFVMLLWYDLLIQSLDLNKKERVLFWSIRFQSECAISGSAGSSHI